MRFFNFLGQVVRYSGILFLPSQNSFHRHLLYQTRPLRTFFDNSSTYDRIPRNLLYELITLHKYGSDQRKEKDLKDYNYLENNLNNNSGDDGSKFIIPMITICLIISSSSLLMQLPEPAYAIEENYSFMPSNVYPSDLQRMKTQKTSFFNAKSDYFESKARKELTDLKVLQDSRLDMCADRGDNWEQCFMFGDSQSPTSGGYTVKGKFMIKEGPSSKEGFPNRPPTW